MSQQPAQDSPAYQSAEEAANAEARRTLKAKLQQFWDTLSPDEQRIFSALVEEAAADVLGYDDGSPGLPPISTPTPDFSYPYETSDGYSYPYTSPGGFSYPYFGRQEPPAH
jgi:hypothetical protein